MIKIKGAKGGEEKGMELRFGDADYQEIGVSGNALSAFTTAGGEHPVITTEFMTIMIDMNNSEIIEDMTQNKVPMLKNFLSIHFNFIEEGEIFIDQIWLTTSPDAPIAEDESTTAVEENTTSAATTKANDSVTTKNNDDNSNSNATVANTVSNPKTGVAGIAVAGILAILALGGLAISLQLQIKLK